MIFSLTYFMHLHPHIEQGTAESGQLPRGPPVMAAPTGIRISLPAQLQQEEQDTKPGKGHHLFLG